MEFAPQRCLIVGPSWVGDMVMAQSLFKALRERFPTLQIDVLAPTWSKPILAAMPEVNVAIEMPLQHGELALGKRYQLGKSLRASQYDWAIVLPSSLKSAFIPFWAKIPVRTAYKGEMRYGLINDMRPLDKTLLTMTVQRFVYLGLPKEVPLPPQITPPQLIVSAPDKNAARVKFGLVGEHWLALCPGAEYGEAKRWPPEYFAEVGKAWLAKGGQVMLLGSAKDAPTTATIAQLMSHSRCFDLAGDTNLQEVMVLLSLAEHAVSNDSGLMHIAAAVHTPVIALYGSTDPSYTPPLDSNSTILSLKLECSPCFKRECPLGHMNCLRQLLPKQVISYLK